MNNNILSMSLSQLYNDLLQELISSYNEYNNGIRIVDIVYVRNRKFYFGFLLILLGILLIPVID